MIPTIGLIDTDCDPTSVDYPVPANDDTPSSVELMLELFARSIMDGKQLLSQHPVCFSFIYFFHMFIQRNIFISELKRRLRRC